MATLVSWEDSKVCSEPHSFTATTLIQCNYKKIYDSHNLKVHDEEMIPKITFQ